MSTKTSLYICTSIKRTLVGGHRRRVAIRHGAYRYRWPASVAASRHLQAPSQYSDDVAHTFVLSVTNPPLSRRSASLGRWEVSRGPGQRLRARHSKESRRVRRPYLFKRRRHRLPSATDSLLHPPTPRDYQLGYCVTCVCRDRLPPCPCIIDVLSNGRNKERKKIRTSTRPQRHSHRRRCIWL